MEILDQFGIKPILLLAQIVNFLILLYILKRVLYKPLLKVLEERKKVIADSLKNAQDIEDRLLKISDAQEEEIRKAGKEGAKIIQDATAQAVGIIEEGKKKSTDIIEKALKQAEEVSKAESEKIRKEIKSELAGIVILALQKVTGKILSQDDQKELIEASLKNIQK